MVIFLSNDYPRYFYLINFIHFSNPFQKLKMAGPLFEEDMKEGRDPAQSEEGDEKLIMLNANNIL